MHGKFFSYAAERCAGGELGPSGNGYLGTSVLGEDRDGNIWLYGRPRKGEGVSGWIRRQVVEALESAPDRLGARPWWKRQEYTVVVVEDYGMRGQYMVSVNPYRVDLIKWGDRFRNCPWCHRPESVCVEWGRIVPGDKCCADCGH